MFTGHADYTARAPPVSVLSRCFWRVLHPLLCNIPPYLCLRGCCTPIRVTACKADLYSIIIITKQLHTCKYTAINCTIVTLRIGAGFKTSALDFTPLHPPISKFWQERCYHRTAHCPAIINVQYVASDKHTKTATILQAT